jgi:hypothetical protein
MADTGRGVAACYPPHRDLAIGRSRARSLIGSAREWQPPSDRNCGSRTFIPFSTARTFFDGDSGTQNVASYMGTAGSLRMENRLIDIVVFAFVFFFIVPLVISAVLYALGDRVEEWRTADRSSAGLLPPVRADQGAVVRVFSARTVRWRGIIATHSWIVVKEANAAYSRFDFIAWGEPIWIDRFVPDGRWFGRMPQVIFAADGASAERMIPRIREAVRGYAFQQVGDYRVWPGPNSNTFVAAVMSSITEISVRYRDYPDFPPMVRHRSAIALISPAAK